MKNWIVTDEYGTLRGTCTRFYSFVCLFVCFKQISSCIQCGAMLELPKRIMSMIYDIVIVE